LIKIRHSVGSEVLLLATVAGCILNVALNSLALIGVAKKSASLIVPWLINGAVQIVTLLSLGAYHLVLLWTSHETVSSVAYSHEDGPVAVDLTVALGSSLSKGELCVYTILASGGVALYLAFLVYLWIMVKVSRTISLLSIHNANFRY